VGYKLKANGNVARQLLPRSEHQRERDCLFRETHAAPGLRYNRNFILRVAARIVLGVEFLTGLLWTFRELRAKAKTVKQARVVPRSSM
jgi:hypothetical protein